MLWIRNILVRIRSTDPYLCLTDPDADPGGPKTYGSGCEVGTLVKSHKEVTRFFFLFLLDDRRTGAGSVLVTNGSGCGSERLKRYGSRSLTLLAGKLMVAVRRRILLECFVVMCSIDRPVISLLLSSVLPLEVAQVNLNPFFRS